jgi:hypothetical protein
MAVRIRKDGTILCAAMHPEQEGDTYLHDGLHYQLAVVERVLVTEPHERHRAHGQWWWAGSVPEGVVIDEFYLTRPGEGKRLTGADPLRPDQTPGV